METLTDHNRRIARNSLWLAMRMVVVTAIGLYTSRIILRALGTTDYGVFAVVGSLTAAMAFLNTTMAGATSRFFAFAAGKNDSAATARTFSAALAAHIIIAVVAIAIAETAGSWFLNTRLRIPPALMSTANWLLQFSILSMGAAIIQTPYLAAIIAREQMKTFAWVETAQSLLKLASALALTLFTDGRLIAYGILSCAIALTVTAAYILRCRASYSECRAPARFSRSDMKPLLSFSAYDLYGNLCVSVRAQATEWLINIFFGVLFNAGAAVATIANNAILGLASTVTTALRPRAIKLYAAGDIPHMSRLLGGYIVMSLWAMATIAAPCFIEADFLLTAWLGDTPAGAALFLRIILIQSIIAIPVTVLSIAIHATGDIKKLSFINGTIYLAAAPAVLIAFRIGSSVGWAFALSAITTAIAFFSTFAIARSLIPSLPSHRLILRAISAIIVAFVSGLAVIALCAPISQGWLRLTIVAGSYLTINGAAFWLLLLKSDERRAIKAFFPREPLPPLQR